MEKTINITKYSIILLSFVLLLFITGCGKSSKVTIPLNIQEETKEEETEEITEEEPEEESSEDTEEFKLLEPDETITRADVDGILRTEDGQIVVDLVFFMGQSNMSGAGGDAKKAPPVPEGHGYEFRAISDPNTLYPITEPFGKNESFIGGICDLMGAKKGSLVSAFTDEYYAQTGVPIVGVSASQGASTTEIWQSAGFQNDMKTRYDNAVKYLTDNDYYIRNRYAIWFQGESDAANHVDPLVYNTNMDNIIRPLFISGLNKVFIVTPGRTLSIKNYFSDIIDQQLEMCKTSGYYALGTNLLSGVSAEYMVDEWHYNQDVLNLIGIETAKSVACYTLNKKERLDYDYKHGCTYIPDMFGYTGKEEVEPLELKNISSLLSGYWDNYLSSDYSEYWEEKNKDKNLEIKKEKAEKKKTEAIQNAKEQKAASEAEKTEAEEAKRLYEEQQAQELLLQQQAQERMKAEEEARIQQQLLEEEAARNAQSAAEAAVSAMGGE